MTKRPLPSPATARQTALAAAVCLLCAAPLHAAPPEYTSLAGVKAAGFQKWLDDAQSKGFRPVYINGYNAGDHLEFAGVAVKDDMNLPWEAKYNLTSEEYQKALDEYTKKGFHPWVVSGYVIGGAPRFAAVWGKDDGRVSKWEARHNLSKKEYEETARTMRKDKLRTYRLTGYADPEGGIRFTALFIRWGDTDPDWESQLDLTADQCKEKIDDWHDRGFRPTDISAYDTPDGPRFIVVAFKPERPGEKLDWIARVGMSGEKYQKEFDKQGADGFRPRAICGYKEGGEVRFAAFWNKGK